MKNLCKRLILATLVLTAGVSQAWFENISFKKTSAKVAAVVAFGAAAYGLWKYYNSSKPVDSELAKRKNDCNTLANAGSQSYQNDGMNLTGQTGTSLNLSSYSEPRVDLAPDSKTLINMTHQGDQTRLQ